MRYSGKTEHTHTLAKGQQLPGSLTNTHGALLAAGELLQERVDAVCILAAHQQRVEAGVKQFRHGDWQRV